MGLDEIRKQLPRSNWQHSKLFEYAMIAKDKGISLREFLLLPTEDQAYDIATRRAESTIKAYEEYLADKEARRKSH